MGRIRALIKWEFNDMIRNVLLLLGIVLVGMLMKRSLMGVTYSTGVASGTNMELFGPSRAVDLSIAIQSALTLTDVWTLVGFLILLLGALIFRYDKDKGVAHSIYSLPYSNTEIFGIKLLSLFIYSFTMVLLPFTYVILTSYADIAGYLPEVTSNFIGEALVLIAFLVLYLVAIATVVSLASSNAFLAFIIGFTVLYIPKILGTSSIPPSLFINAIQRCSGTGFNLLTLRYLGWGVGAPLLLFGVAFVLITRRDVL